ncbi:hypothetical protein DFAR_1620006 [Desulfarculales bacterium]
MASWLLPSDVELSYLLLAGSTSHNQVASASLAPWPRPPSRTGGSKGKNNEAAWYQSLPRRRMASKLEILMSPQKAWKLGGLTSISLSIPGR